LIESSGSPSSAEGVYHIMPLLEINRNPSSSELSTFGRFLPLFGATVAGSVWWQSGSWHAAAVVAGAAAAATLLFFAVPRLQKAMYVGWTRAVYPVGWTVSHTALAAIYFIVIMPTGVGLRWLRGDPLARRFDRSAQSYWQRRRRGGDAETYFRQF
jgi:hypothetical protein